MFKGKVTILVLVLFFVTANVQGQQIKPSGQFLADSISIGIPVGYSLAVKYPRGMDIVFPDSLYNFDGFELHHKQYFPTRSDSVFSYDSAVYYINSFEIDSVQKLALPVFILHGNDSTAIYTAPDSVILQQLIAKVPDSVAVEALPLRENTTYKRVSYRFNYPYFILGMLILGIIIVLVIVIFGKRIKKYFVLRKMTKAHHKFLEKYELVENSGDQAAKIQAERLLVLWKQYLEKLLAKPYTQLTTKEIIHNYNPEDIEDTLKKVDRTIYGSTPGSEFPGEEFTVLKEFARKKYTEKVEEVKNG